MATNSLFQTQQPAIQTYDVNQLAPQFADWNFQVGAAYDKNTPLMCIYTINEIQAQAVRTNHPIRIGFFNIMSENHFNNQKFQDLMYAVVNRVGYGVTNGEWRTLDIAVADTIKRVVKACASAMAAEDPEFMSTLADEDRRAALINAELWHYVVALANGQANYVSFEQMGAANGLSNVSTSTQSALEAARNLRGQSSAGFVENYSTVASTQYNNNGGQENLGRYARRAEVMHGKIQGSLQTALKESGATTPAAPYQSRFQRSATNDKVAPPVTRSFTQAAAAKFDSNVTDFSMALTDVEVVTNVESVKEEPTLFTVPMGNSQVDIVRERTDEGYASWKPSKLQPYHPAWCVRTHKARYFQTRTGEVVVILQALAEDQRELAMNYEAHAIDPTKGKPASTVPVKPVREEAKIMYAKADNVTINVVVSKAYTMEEEVSGAISSVRLKASMQEKKPDAFAQVSSINTPIIYDTTEEADADFEKILAVSNASTFAEAATILATVANDLAREQLNSNLVKAINSTIENQLGVNVRIDNFMEDGPLIVEALGNAKGMIFGDKLGEHQQNILTTNVKVEQATSIPAHTNAIMSTDDGEELSEDFIKRVLFLQRNVCACWVNYTNNELAIGMPPKGAAPIHADSLGGVYRIASAVFKEAIGKMASSEQFLVTKDGVVYNLHQGLLLRDCYLLSRKA